MKNFIKENLYHLFKPVDIASIVYYRILFGALMIHSMLKIFYTGKIQRYWLGPDFNFTYYGFHWVEPLPGDGLYYLTFIMLILAIFVTIGFLYRISTFLFLLGFTYYYLLEQSLYLNHFYLTILIIFILIFIPANRLLSVDSKLNPNIKSQTAPAWTLWMLRFQMGIVYFYGGIAKLNMDWTSFAN